MGLSSQRQAVRLSPRPRSRRECRCVHVSLDNGIEWSDLQTRYVARDRRNASVDEGCGLFQLLLSSPSDHDVRAFFHEALGCGQANPAASACDNRNSARQFFVQHYYSCVFSFGFSLFSGEFTPKSNGRRFAYLLLLEQILEDEEPQVRPRACTSAPPSLNFPSLTGANPSCLGQIRTGAIASSSSSLDRKTTR